MSSKLIINRKKGKLWRFTHLHLSFSSQSGWCCITPLLRRCQWLCLLAISLVFFAASGWQGIFFLFFTALTVWGGGLWLARLDADCAARRKAPGITKDEKKAVKAKTQRHKKGVVALVLVTNFLVLGYFKYWSYFVRLLAGAVAATAPSALGLVMPLGISFYTFQAIGYLIDCFRGRHPAEKNPARFLLFISIFPAADPRPHQPVRSNGAPTDRRAFLGVGAHQACPLCDPVRCDEKVCHCQPDCAYDCRDP